MPTYKRNQSTDDERVLTCLSKILNPLVSELTYREAKACGISDGQYYAIKREQPVNFTVLSLRNLAKRFGTSASFLLDEAENIPRLTSRPGSRGSELHMQTD